ncbi:MAG: class I SAM-dependent RNA methyltransferase [Bryobacteraceae bacterium]
MEKWVYGGEGLARLDGRVALIPFVLPGEEVRAEAERESANLVRARLAKVVTPAPERVAPACPYFGRCGGCHYQHAPYEFQLAAKTAILRDQLRRIGHIEAPDEIAVVSGEPWNYRNRSQFHIRGTQLGYLEMRSHNLCPIEQCPIGSPRLNEIIATLRQMLRDRRWPRFVRALEVFTDERQVQLNVLETGQPLARRFFEWCAERIGGLVPGELEYSAGGFTFRVNRHAFFQVNRFLPERLVETALAGARGESALDLYAGVGLFALPLARRFAHVTAVEAGGSAARDLAFNAERAGLAVETVQRDVADYLETIERPPDFALLDPPRAGLGRRVVRRLAELRPPRLAIVSCDPSTLARDLAGLLEAGYAVDRLALVDLFPQTFHLETVVALRLLG